MEGYGSIEAVEVDVEQVFQKAIDYRVDFRDVRGQEHAKRALEVATAGGHNIIMLGSKDKSMKQKIVLRELPIKFRVFSENEMDCLRACLGILRGDSTEEGELAGY